MNVFTPYTSPIKTAECLDYARLNKQIIECTWILDGYRDNNRRVKSHPAAKQYRRHLEWLEHYKLCLVAYRTYKKSNNDEDLKEAVAQSALALKLTPSFLTEAWCDNMKKRLYTKAPDLYPQFAEYGKSYENWYYVNRRIKKFKQMPE